MKELRNWNKRERDEDDAKEITKKGLGLQGDVMVFLRGKRVQRNIMAISYLCHLSNNRIHKDHG